MRPSCQISAAAALLLATSVGAEFLSFEERANLGTMTYIGCYSDSTGLSFNKSYTYMTSGYCQPLCVDNSNDAVLALTKKTDCWCGNELPPSDTLVDDSKCDAGCAGYGSDPCGSSDGKYYTVYLTGTLDKGDVQNATDSGSSTSSSSSSSTKTATPSVVTVGSTVVTVTASAQAESASAAAAAKSSKANTAGIIAGVVVGITAIAAIAGGLFFFFRHKRRQQIQEEYNRNNAINNFVANGKPPQSSGGYSNMTDNRLDPAAMRRMSDGSIADNEDYSRKILRVTNA